jgi:anti-sigma B factor antagonist/stage II sporulation protein AA (anti-sigma F factor antagonist)
MELSVRSRGDGIIRLSVAGRITLREVGGADPLRALAGEQVYGERILLNLQSVEFLDSSGVSWLLNCHIRCREAGGALVLHTIHPLALKVLTTLRMHHVLTLAENEEDALKLARPPVKEHS